MNPSVASSLGSMNLLHSLTKKMSSSKQSSKPANVPMIYVLSNINASKKFTEQDFIDLKRQQRKRMIAQGRNLSDIPQNLSANVDYNELKKYFNKNTFRNIVSVRKKNNTKKSTQLPKG